MSSVPPQNGWLGEPFNYTYGHVYDYAPAQPSEHAHNHTHLSYRDNNNHAASSSSVLPHSRTVSRPRVNMACKHCRQRKVRCDGKKPKCSLCTRLNRPCDYVKVTEEENAMLRDKKRKSKIRKNAEQEAARANLHKHDTFPVYHPYRSTATGAHRNSFGSDAARAGEDRKGLLAPPLPQVVGTSTSSSSSTIAGQQQPYLYDGRVHVASLAMHGVGAGQDRFTRLSPPTSAAARRIASSSYNYPRERSSEAVAYARTSTEPRSRYDGLLSNNANNASGSSSNPATVMASAGLNLVPTMSTQELDSYAFSTAMTNYGSFRALSPTEPDTMRNHTTASQRHLGTTGGYEPLASPTSHLAPQHRQHRERSEFRNLEPDANPNTTLALGLGGYEPTNLSVSPSVASPGYATSMPALVGSRAPSSTCSRASASPVSPKQHHPHQLDDGTLWSSAPATAVTLNSQLAYRHQGASDKTNPVAQWPPSHQIHLPVANHHLVSLYTPHT